MRKPSVDDLFKQAQAHHRAGRLDRAERLYRDMLTRDGSRHDACAFLGLVMLVQKRDGEALEWMQRATELSPDNADYLMNLGAALRRIGRVEEASGAFTKVVVLRPEWAEAHFNLAATLEQLGSSYTVVAFERAAALAPDNATIQRGAAAALMRRNELARSLPLWERAVTLDDSAENLVELGTNHRLLGEHRTAVQVLTRALAKAPRSPTALVELGAARMELAELDAAEDGLKLALSQSPRSVPALFNYSSVLLLLGRAAESIDALRNLLQIEPSNAEARSKLLVALNYDPQVSDEELLREATEWARRHAPESRRIRHGAGAPDPARRLRVGYYAGDFTHLAPFLTPLIERHDRDGFELFYYSGVAMPDSFVAAVACHEDRFRDVGAFSDDELVRLIAEDGLDVLVDLTMHLVGGRLPVFARGPARVQIAWLAYPGTTGVPAMRFRLTDPHLDPPGGPLPYSETSIRLPGGLWPYAPVGEHAPAAELPARSNGFVTFGSLNAFSKVHGGVLDVWGRVLARVDGSRLRMLAPRGGSRERVLAALSRHGVAAERIEFVDSRPHDEYMETYRGIDVCLDTFPTNGHTTSLDAFYMGVPVVTLSGDRVVGRGGASIAKNLGLTELVATTTDEYVETAARLAADLPSLEALRASLRDRMRQAPFMDAEAFVRQLERAYREAVAIVARET